MFNFSKFSQVPITPIGPSITDAEEDVERSISDNEESNMSTEDAKESVDNKLEKNLIDQSTNVAIWQAFSGLQNTRPDLAEAMNSVMAQSGIINLGREISPQSIAALNSLIDDAGLQSTTQVLETTPEVQQWNQKIQRLLERIKSASDQKSRNQAGMLPQMAFNLKQHKMAQAPMGQVVENVSKFPVTSVADFVDKFVDDLLLFNSEEVGTSNYQRAVNAFNEIESVVSGGFAEEANSALETITEMSPDQRDDAVKILMEIYEVFLPDSVKQEHPQQEETIMSDKQPKGIIRFNLNEHILNNKTAEKSEGMTKTAADQFGQQYLLYGPTEKRICPKLRGKNLSVGDVVSEYTCRHHCIDGIVIDDNKTICGEALWRANAMDKYSREYVDKGGKVTGGYLNKRFEINRLNIDDENRMKLKPGETRKPRPASQGNMESRLQDMRNKEGQKRDYRPNVNTGKPFEWCHDVDQNNVQVTQEERNRREEATGHQLVQYMNQNQGENNIQNKTASSNTSICGRCGEEFEGIGYECPGCKKDEKKAFNLKNHKTAQLDPYTNTKRSKPGSHDEYREHSTINRMKREKCPDCKDTVCRCHTGDPGDPFKTAQLDFTGNPLPYRTFDQMGKDFSPEGTFNHCQSCNKRVPTEDLVSEDNGIGGSMSVCRECQNPKTKPKTKPMSMTGPRGPIGPDNPQSDDLGLSDDFLRDGLDYESDFMGDDGLMGRSPEEVEFQSNKAEIIEEVISSVLGMNSKEEILNYLRKQLEHSENLQFETHDWDDIADEANSHLEGLGESIIDNDEFNYAANKKTNKLAELPHPMQVKRPYFADRDTGSHNKKVDKHIPSINPTMVPSSAKPADVDPKIQTYDYGKPMKKKKSFNLKSFKTAKTEDDEDGDFSYKGETFDVNPFAICNKSTGGKSKVGKEKWERCVQEVKSKNKKSQSEQIFTKTATEEWMQNAIKNSKLLKNQKSAQMQQNPMQALTQQACKSCGQPVTAREQINNNGLCSRCVQQQATQGPGSQTSGGIPTEAALNFKKKSKQAN